jgi:flagellar FliL protein
MANTGDTDQPGLVRLKLQLAYQKDNIKLQNELNERRSEIRDLILLTLGEQKKSDLASSESKRKFKDVLSNRINRVLVAGKIEDVYYDEFSVN